MQNKNILEFYVIKWHPYCWRKKLFEIRVNFRVDTDRIRFASRVIQRVSAVQFLGRRDVTEVKRVSTSLGQVASFFIGVSTHRSSTTFVRAVRLYIFSALQLLLCEMGFLGLFSCHGFVIDNAQFSVFRSLCCIIKFPEIYEIFSDVIKLQHKEIIFGYTKLFLRIII